MLEVLVPKMTFWDEKNEEFISIEEQVLKLEHSLLSISKWESKYHKVFLSKNVEKTDEEISDYIRCMTIGHEADPLVYKYLPEKVMKEISSYIENSMTASWFNEDEKKKETSREAVTSELIYYWMVVLQIPFECEKWHLNRLMTLIQICNIKNQPKKKHSLNDLRKRNKKLNEERLKKYNTTG